MTKEEVLCYIRDVEWTEDVEAAIGCALGRFVVYQQDPDTHFVYGHKYYFTKEAARKDFESRKIYSSGWCYCVFDSMDDSNQYDRRTIYSS